MGLCAGDPILDREVSLQLHATLAAVDNKASYRQLSRRKPPPWSPPPEVFCPPWSAHVILCCPGAHMCYPAAHVISCCPLDIMLPWSANVVDWQLVSPQHQWVSCRPGVHAALKCMYGRSALYRSMLSWGACRTNQAFYVLHVARCTPSPVALHCQYGMPPQRLSFPAALECSPDAVFSKSVDVSSDSIVSWTCIRCSQ